MRTWMLQVAQHPLSLRDNANCRRDKGSYLDKAGRTPSALPALHCSLSYLFSRGRSPVARHDSGHSSAVQGTSGCSHNSPCPLPGGNYKVSKISGAPLNEKRSELEQTRELVGSPTS